jgi:hypothetical protein
MKVKMIGWTVTEYRILVRTGAIVSGTYATSKSGRRTASPRRQESTAPAPKAIKVTMVAKVATRYMRALDENCWAVW